MVGALNKLPIAASGIMFFGDKATFGNITAIIVGMLYKLYICIYRYDINRMT